MDSKDQVSLKEKLLKSSISNSIEEKSKYITDSCESYTSRRTRFESFVLNEVSRSISLADFDVLVSVLMDLLNNPKEFLVDSTSDSTRVKLK